METSSLRELAQIVADEHPSSSITPFYYTGNGLGKYKSDYIYIGYFMDTRPLIMPAFLGDSVGAEPGRLVLFSEAYGPVTFVGYRIFVPGRAFPPPLITDVSIGYDGVNHQFVFTLNDGSSQLWVSTREATENNLLILDRNYYIGKAATAAVMGPLHLTFFS